MKIELKNVGLQYDGKPPLFRNLSLTLENHDFVLIQGPSGSGKSSLLRLLNRLHDPTEGEILVDNRPIAGHDVIGLRRRTGFVQQTPVVVDGTVEDNLTFAFRFKAARDQQPPSQEALKTWMADFLLSGVALSDRADKLSVGQKQRIALIRTLLAGPEILLCDEPTSALDPQSREIVETWLERVNLEQHTGVVLVTHLDFAAKRVRPRAYRLHTGGLEGGAP